MEKLNENIRYKDEKKTLLKSIVIKTAFAQLFGLTAITLIISILAFMSYKMDNFEKYAMFIVYTAAVAGGFVTGFTGATGYKSKGLLIGVLMGLSIIALLLILGLVVFKTLITGQGFAITAVLTILSSAAGGVVRINNSR